MSFFQLAIAFIGEGNSCIIKMDNGVRFHALDLGRKYSTTNFLFDDKNLAYFVYVNSIIMESRSVIFSSATIDFKGLTGYSKIAILTDLNTRKYCYPLIQNSLTAHQLI